YQIGKEEPFTEFNKSFLAKFISIPLSITIKSIYLREPKNILHQLKPLLNYETKKLLISSILIK
ncbi:MAG: hypothetical protein K6T54_04705, partial [Ignavibacterium sp.]|nr:hypothetical protein [Ignavibacterium sp.]